MTRREDLERTERRIRWVFFPGLCLFIVVDLFGPDGNAKWILLGIIGLVAIWPWWIAWIVVIWRLRAAKKAERDGAPHPGG